MTRVLPVTCCCLGLVGAGWATEVGDPAPELTIGEWVKGEPVDFGPGGTNVIIVDFWASWSPICRTTMPKLSRLRRAYADRGLVVVGIADQNPRAVRHFVGKVGEDLDYPVGVDVAHRTFRSYMVPFKAGGVPHTFVIDRTGKVVWHGHPMRGLDQVVGAVVEGTFDPEAARAESKAESRAQAYLGRARGGEAGPGLRALGKLALGDMEDYPEALNHFAWMILTDDGIQARDHDLALSAAKTAYEGTSGRVAAIADTYARALVEEGNTDMAIAIQRKALERAEDERLKVLYRDTLSLYLEKLEGSVVKLAK